jgi:nucleotide-binding universal stress UspA family protein
MGLINNILFPVDFSEACVGMSAYVRRAAVFFSAKVSMIHVYDPMSHSGLEMAVRPLVEIAEDHEEIARHKLDGFLAKELPSAEVSRLIVAGDPATEIVRAAQGFDLIHMPTHAGRFWRMLLGSTTAKVLNAAKCPITTSQHAETIAPRSLEHREWVCAVGLGEESERVLRFAAQGSAQAGARLTIIHAIQGPDRPLPVQTSLREEVQSKEAQQARERIDDLQRAFGINAAVRIGVGPIKDTLLELARQSDGDVLIIGRSSRPGVHERLRDLTYAMIRDSPFAVTSV